MRILLVDDEPLALLDLERTLQQIAPEAALYSFLSAEKALAATAEILPEVAFLDIQMPGINGLGLAKALKDRAPTVNIIFVSAYSDYMAQAFTLHASGYITKPVTLQDISRELNDLRYPLARPAKRIRIQTFGNFEVFADGKPIHFSRSRAKEILAYLVDRKGAGVSKKELAGILWSDEAYTRSKQYELQHLVQSLIKSLQAVQAEAILIRQHNSLAVDTSQFDCDYYQFERWDTQAINAYHGEYMANYSWAEWTAGALDKSAHIGN